MITLKNQNDFIILENEEAFSNIVKINNVKIKKNSDSTELLKIDFRWSTDSHTFSEWYEMTVENLNSYIKYLKYISFWIDFKITLLNNVSQPVEITTIELDVDYKNENNSIPLLIANPIDDESHYYPIQPNDYDLDIYKQNPTIKLQKDLSLFVNNLFGHDVTYFRSEPKTRTRDVVFLEWTLYKYSEPQKVKIVVPNNEFPDNKFNFAHLGIDFEIPFEVHIDKRYWESIFGRKTLPQKRDAIYFPLVNRMYKVASTQPIRDFMQEVIYYKVSLVKWTEQSNIEKTENVKNIIDEVTTSVHKLFNEEIDSEINSVVNKMQTKDKTTVDDPIRILNSSFDINSYINEEKLENNNTTIATYHYNLAKLFDDKSYIKAVEYNEKVAFKKSDNLCYSCWFNMPEEKQIKKEIKKIDLVNNIATIEFMYGMPKITVGGWLKIQDSVNDKIQIIGEIENIIEDIATFKAVVKIPEYLLQNVNNIQVDWHLKETLLGFNVARRNLLFGNNNNSGINIDIYDKNLFLLKLNEVEYWYNIENLTYNYWYGLVLNISNRYGQIGLHIWKRKLNENTTKLDKVFAQVYLGLSSIDRIADINYSILSSIVKITNIRLLNETIEDEKHSIFLNQNIISDAQIAMIIDNAIPKLKLPYIANVK